MQKHEAGRLGKSLQTGVALEKGTRRRAVARDVFFTHEILPAWGSFLDGPIPRNITLLRTLFIGTLTISCLEVSKSQNMSSCVASLPRGFWALLSKEVNVPCPTTLCQVIIYLLDFYPTHLDQRSTLMTHLLSKGPGRGRQAMKTRQDNEEGTRPVAVESLLGAVEPGEGRGLGRE